MRAIHLALSNPRRRFAAIADPAFSELFDLLTHADDNDDYETMLVDFGEGAADCKLMAAVENGTRQVALRSVHAMGGNAGKQAEAYGAVKRWRKAESYIQACRIYWGRENYMAWKKFLWSDFVERDALRATYYARHAPVSDGKDHPCFGGLVGVPPEWSRKRKFLMKKKKKKKKRASLTTTGGGAAKMVWDARKNALVPVIVID